jgi:acyl-CoA synthetase (AMP-forming)/AMP-acid ligase II
MSTLLEDPPHRNPEDPLWKNPQISDVRMNATCTVVLVVCRLVPTLVLLYINQLFCCLCDLVQVLEAAVVGIPHAKWGERPLLVVVPQPQYAPGEHRCFVL